VSLAKYVGFLLLVAVLAGPQYVASASPPSASGWAVLIENDWYTGRYANLPVGYANSTRMLSLLLRRGWSPDHILLVRDNLDPTLLGRTLSWLADRVRPGDTAVLYIAGEYEFFARDLQWGATFPGLWSRIPTTHRVLVVQTCFAERLAEVVREIPGIALPAVGREERDWWGLRKTDPFIHGGTFTYYLTRALEDQPQDDPLEWDAAFAAAVAGVQTYFRTVVFRDPGALDVFHKMGEHPEHLDRFPNPHLIVGTGSSMLAVEGATLP
jgi:hypothetical protein